MSGASPARVTVRELDKPRMRRVTREWQVLLDGAPTDYTIIQYAADVGYQLSTRKMLLMGEMTFDGAIFRVADKLGVLGWIAPEDGA